MGAGSPRRGGKAIPAVTDAKRAGAAAREKGGAGFLSALFLLIRPGIQVAVSLSGLAGMTLAARGLPSPGRAAAGLCAILLSASGAAIVNSLLEADRDARMARLHARVEALEEVGAGTAALFAAGLIAAALLLSWRALTATAAGLVAAAVASYTVVYTLFFKRRSPYGTVPGGIPGALPVLIGHAAVDPQIGAGAWVLFILMVLWQPPHFWTLAMKYRDDYRAAGIPVLPVAFGEPFTRLLIFIYAAALLPLSLCLRLLGGLSAGFAAAALLLGAGFLASLYCDTVRSRRYGRAFCASILYIVGILLAVIVDLAA